MPARTVHPGVPVSFWKSWSTSKFGRLGGQVGAVRGILREGGHDPAEAERGDQGGSLTPAPWELHAAPLPLRLNPGIAISILHVSRIHA